MPVFLNERLLSLGDAALLLPHRPNASTLWRWASRGYRGHRLEVIRIGSRAFTSREALERFVTAINSEPPPAHALPDGRARRRHTAAADAHARLSADGI